LLRLNTSAHSKGIHSLLPIAAFRGCLIPLRLNTYPHPRGTNSLLPISALRDDYLPLRLNTRPAREANFFEKWRISCEVLSCKLVKSNLFQDLGDSWDVCAIIGKLTKAEYFAWKAFLLEDFVFLYHPIDMKSDEYLQKKVEKDDDAFCEMYACFVMKLRVFCNVDMLAEMLLDFEDVVREHDKAMEASMRCTFN
jgi:hypothetical protein